MKEWLMFRLNIIFCRMKFHIFFWSFLGAGFFVFAEPDTREDRKVRLTEGESYSSVIRGVELDFPKEISLKGEKPDLSDIIQQFRKVEESEYDNIPALEEMWDKLLRGDGPIEKLCSKTTNSQKCLDETSGDLAEAIEEIEQKMAGRILYPTGYRPLSETGVENEAFQQASEILDLGCEHCMASGLSKVLMQGSQEQYQRLYNKLKDKRCQKDLLQSISRDLQSQSFPKQCLEEESKNHPVCEGMIKNMNILRERVPQLTNLAYGQESTEAQALCMDCVFGKKIESFDKLGNFLKELRDQSQEQSQCLELDPGEEKDVFSGNGLKENYVLKRDRDGSYSITFPVEFHVDDDYDGPVSKEKAPDHYRERIQKCLTEASQKLLGPKGEKLKIQIKDPSTGKSNSKNQSQCGKSPNEFTRNISIGSESHRSHSRKYASDIDCPTITHEFLHLTGLCDEYKEKSMGFYTDPETREIKGQNFGYGKNQNIDSSSHDFKPAFDCRVTAQNSIMSNQYIRWNNVKKGKNKSLLTPGQFQSILYGSCPGKNKRFNECAKLAYQSSPTAEENCQEAKLQCEKENSLGHDK